MNTELGKIETTEVPAIMAGYQLCDMQEELWCYQYSDGQFLAVTSKIAGVEMYNGRAGSKDPDQILKVLNDNSSPWRFDTPKISGDLVQRALKDLLNGSDVVIYFDYPSEYDVIQQAPGDTP